LDEKNFRGQFNQTFFSKRKDVGAQGFAKKISSISPTIDAPDLRLKSLENSPNLCAVCQGLFDKKASYLVYSKKSGKNVGEIDPRSQQTSV
jgi:hypothetical protein